MRPRWLTGVKSRILRTGTELERRTKLAARAIRRDRDPGTVELPLMDDLESVRKLLGGSARWFKETVGPCTSEFRWSRKRIYNGQFESADAELYWFHVAKLLPLLSRGVLIHHHDILWPYVRYFRDDPPSTASPTSCSITTRRRASAVASWAGRRGCATSARSS